MDKDVTHIHTHTHTHTHTDYLAMRKKEILPSVTCMDLEDIMLSQIRQTKIDKPQIRNLNIPSLANKYGAISSEKFVISEFDTVSNNLTLKLKQIRNKIHV